jgi:hypothetical protein
MSYDYYYDISSYLCQISLSGLTVTNTNNNLINYSLSSYIIKPSSISGYIAYYQQPNISLSLSGFMNNFYSKFITISSSISFNNFIIYNSFTISSFLLYDGFSFLSNSGYINSLLFSISGYTSTIDNTTINTYYSNYINNTIGIDTYSRLLVTSLSNTVSQIQNSTIVDTYARNQILLKANIDNPIFTSNINIPTNYKLYLKSSDTSNFLTYNSSIDGVVINGYTGGSLRANGSDIINFGSGGINVYGNASITGQLSAGSISYSGSTIFEESTGSVASATTGSLIIRHKNSYGSSSIMFPSVNNSNSDYAYIQYNENYNGNNENGRLIIGCENDRNTDSTGENGDAIILWCASGNGKIGCNTMTPQYTLHVNGTFYVSTTSTLNGTLNMNNDIYMINNKIYFRGIGDTNHYIGYNSIGIDGPIIQGNDGGTLSVTSGSVTSLTWTNTKVTIPIALNVTGTSSLSIATITNSIRMNNNIIYLRESTDNNHSISYNSSSDGPRLTGYRGGSMYSSYSSEEIINWNNDTITLKKPTYFSSAQNYVTYKNYGSNTSVNYPINISPVAYLVNSNSGSHPIFNSILDLSVYGMSNQDDYFLVGPYTKLICYNQTSAYGTKMTLDNTANNYYSYYKCVTTNSCQSIQVFNNSGVELNYYYRWGGNISYA